jgi:hypothetical protein
MASKPLVEVHTLEICEVALLVEAGSVQTERVDDIDDLLLRVLGTFFSLLSRSVGTRVCVAVSLHCCCVGQRGAGRRTERLSTNGDLPAVGLVGNAVNLLEVVRVGDDLVVGDDVLQWKISMMRHVNVGASEVARRGGALEGRRGSCAAGTDMYTP